MKRLILIATLVLGVALVVAPMALASTSSGMIDKDCDGVYFTGVVAEGAMVRLEVRLHDTADWQSPVLQDDYIVLAIPGPYSRTVPWVSNPSGRLNRTAISVSMDGGLHWTLLAIDESFLYCAPGGEGCTPGYWKNHLEDWPPTGYSPADDFDSVFGVDMFSPDITLGEAINAKGGGVKKLARHGTAGLLSAAHLDVDYPYSVAEAIALVQAGMADALVEANELGCSIP